MRRSRRDHSVFLVSLTPRPSASLAKMAPAGKHIHDIGEHKITVLSKSQSLPKWSFSKADRFRTPRPLSRETSVTSSGGTLNQSTSTFLPSHLPSHNQSATTFTTGAPTPFGEEEFSIIRNDEDQQDDEDVEGEESYTLANTWSGGWSVGGHVSRLDGSLERFTDAPLRSSVPLPKQYDPATTLGEETALSFQQSPQWSFGGGKSRQDESEAKLKEAIAKVKKAEGKWQKPLRQSASDGTPVEHKLAQIKVRNRSRGFGTEMRLRVRGGPMELAPSPGPAAYEVPRECDLPPQWASSTVVPWGRRTGQRPPCLNPTASDAGPGEYTAHHPFQSSRPSPFFGHPLRERTKDSFPPPTQYTIQSSVGNTSAYGSLYSQPGYSMASRAKPFPPVAVPGPGTYDPDVTSINADTYCATFGRSERVHEADLVDPDEPPGPGTHTVRRDPKAADKPSAGLPRDKRAKVHGLGPDTPAPGTYRMPSCLSKQAVCIGFPLPRPVVDGPAPTDYDPAYTLTHEAAPLWRSPSRTAIRRTLGDNFKEEEEGVDIVKVTGNKWHPPYELKPGGPKWSMAPRRPPRGLGGTGPTPKSENHHSMVGAFASF